MITRPTQSNQSQAEILDSLFVEALSQGQSLWFRVVSGSMRPLLQIGDAIHITPIAPHDLHVGDIAAFQAPEGLVVHRITRIFPSTARFIEMGDVLLRASEISEACVVGRVMAIQRGGRLIDLGRPIAQRVGGVTARLRYWFYCQYDRSRNTVVRQIYRKIAYLFAHIGSTIIRLTCLSQVY